ncbi:MAG: biphenyl 2,3-dioxygenase [Alphaproteobacteria bacterium]|nr:biphenyl 2,3-dioxygenase [Alphaproteobacteria bacterium]
MITHAAGDLTRQVPIEVVVELGTRDGEMRFVPDRLEFETGKLYKLVLVNPSPHKHYFTSPTLAAKVFTRKVDVMYAGNRVAEIKGNIAEIEVFPGGHSEWWFVPVSTGTFSDLHCHVKEPGGASHKDMGMVGTITIR